MNPKSLRRLAADHAQLHNNLPPNYLFAPNHSSDELTTLSILLAGPDGTPYSNGVFTLVLNIPATYPTSPPTACFKTRIWHPNVEEATGKVCVETLKRDWDASLRLYDVLVTISCLLIQPNSASALNAEAGMALDRGWAVYERRARMMTGIHAPVAKELVEAVREAKRRGEEAAVASASGSGEVDEKEELRKRRKEKAAAAAVARIEDGTGEEENAQSSKGEKICRGEGKSTAEPLSQAPENMLGISGIKPIDSARDLTSSMDAEPVIPSATLKRRSTEGPSKPQVPIDAPSLDEPEPSGSTTPLKPPPPQALLLSPSSGPLAEPIYLSWYKGLMVEKTPERVARQKSEHRRLKAAGWDLKLYNRGVVGGVREKRGLKRL